MLAAIIDSLPERDRNALEDRLRGLIEQITLHPKTLAYWSPYAVIHLGAGTHSPFLATYSSSHSHRFFIPT
jgi:hypothetical protein